MSKTFFRYTGSGSDFAALFFKNFILTILTFGIYRPWHRTNVRRYIWNNVEFLGDSGRYSGTGSELFYGWLKLVLYTVAAVIAISIALTISSLIVPKPLLSITQSLSIMCFYIFIFSIGIYSGFRYRLSRTQWRNINFGVERNNELAKKFSILYFKEIGLTILTLGLYYPCFKNNVHKFLLNHTQFGSEKFRYDGSSKEYFSIFWTNIVLCIVTLGIYIPWFFKNTLKYRLSRTHIDKASLGIDIYAEDFFKFGIISFPLFLITFGIASPWIFNWGCKLLTDKIYIDGDINFNDITQIEAKGNAVGDDLAIAYDLDFGF